MGYFMKIIIVSDNHGRVQPLIDVMQLHQDAVAFIHCGDSELPSEYLQGYAGVRGNNDFYSEMPESKIVQIENHRIFVVHGHRLLYMGNRELLVNKAKQNDCDIICFGHTHIFEHQKIDGIDIINPGSISRNRDGSPPCYAILEINGDMINIYKEDYKFGCKL